MNKGNWPGEKFGNLLTDYFEKHERLIWDVSEVDQSIDEGVSYVRFAVQHYCVYSGWDRNSRYQSKWAAVVERDLRHDVETWREVSEEYHSARARFMRNWPMESLHLVATYGTKESTCIRED